MVKSLHFCTKGLLEKLHDPNCKWIRTLRTGWTPSIYFNDVIELKDKTLDNKPVRKGRIVKVEPIQYKKVSRRNLSPEEILRYDRKFHDDHWFFDIIIELQEFVK